MTENVWSARNVPLNRDGGFKVFPNVLEEGVPTLPSADFGAVLDLREGEVLVKVMVCGMDYVDALVAVGGYQAPSTKAK